MKKEMKKLKNIKKQIIAVIASFVVTMKEMRMVIIKWDGHDWEYKWKDCKIYLGEAFVKPSLITEANLHIFYKRYTPKVGDIVIDIGAGVGGEIISLSNLVGITGRVIAVEADPVSLRRLNKLVHNMNLTNVTIIDTAISNEDGHIDFFQNSNFSGIGSSVYATSNNTIKVASMKISTLMDSQELKFVNFMKINIEGAEFDALKSCGDKINSIQNLCISCHDFLGNENQMTYEKVKQYLLDKGKLMYYYPRNSSFVWENYYIYTE